MKVASREPVAQLGTTDFRIGEWTVRQAVGVLARNDETVHLEPRIMQLLVLLAERAPSVVPKDEIIGAIWRNAFVEDSVLPACVHHLRRALRDSARKPRYIQTIPKKGYRLIHEISRSELPSLLAQRRLAGPLRDDATEMFKPKEIYIAVLPFANFCSDPQMTHFADGITADLICRLGKLSGVALVAQRSVNVYKEVDMDVRSIGKELGVRYLLEGNVQCSQESLRVRAQLIDAQSGYHLWANYYDRVREDLFTTQNRIASQIVGEIDRLPTEIHPPTRRRSLTFP